MKKPGFRLRILVAALLPAVLVSVWLSAVFLSGQHDSLDAALKVRARAEARQLASAAEFGMFSGSRELLTALTHAIKAGDPDIRNASILDPDGALLASAGMPSLGAPPPREGREQIIDAEGVTTVVTPIVLTPFAVDDVYAGQPSRYRESPRRIEGYVVLEMSRKALDTEYGEQLMAGAMVTLAGLLLGGWLAVRIVGGVTRPIFHISDVVARIGMGEVSARVSPDPAQAMPQLEEGINRMAERIELTREDMKRQIETATAELRERKEEAERTTQMKSQFLAAASHDLRQPMHALGLFVSRLGQFQGKPEMRQIVKQIEASVSALQDLLDTLLDISRIDAGLVVPKPENFPVAPLLERLALEFVGPAGQKGLWLRVRPSSLQLNCDPLLLERILMNFVSNALRYTQRGGILLACRRRGDRARIEVWDTGDGIPTEFQHDIFGEYVQLANPERNQSKGLGLGLSICDRLARLMKLSLHLRSVPGRGSVFSVEVPLAIAGAMALSTEGSSLADDRLRGTLLVLEDDPLAHAGMVELLTAWGCAVIGAPSVGELLRQCDETACVPDAIICDYRLPGGEDGVTAALRLRERFGPLPVLLVSADDGEALKHVAEQHGFPLLRKPVRPASLRAVLRHFQTLGG